MRLDSAAVDSAQALDARFGFRESARPADPVPATRFLELDLRDLGAHRLEVRILDGKCTVRLVEGDCAPEVHDRVLALTGEGLVAGEVVEEHRLLPALER